MLLVRIDLRSYVAELVTEGPSFLVHQAVEEQAEVRVIELKTQEEQG